MTPLLETLRAKAKAATPGPRMGRTEAFGGRVVWAIYHGVSGQDGFAGKSPIAFVKDHPEAVLFQETNPETLLKLLDALEVIGSCLEQATMFSQCVATRMQAKDALTRAKEILG